MTPCPCNEPGWCEEYQLNLVGRLWILCQDTTPLGEKYRNLWRKQGQPMTSSSNGKTDSTRVSPTRASPCGCGGVRKAPPMNRNAL